MVQIDDGVIALDAMTGEVVGFDSGRIVTMDKKQDAPSAYLMTTMDVTGDFAIVPAPGAVVARRNGAARIAAVA